MMSGAPPAPNGQIRVIGRDGHESAFADGETSRSDAMHASV
jgi:hypothetical protein